MGVLLLALAAALFATRDLYACSCIGSPQPCEAVWNTPYVFTGTVTAMRREGNLGAVTFRVERTWRHDMPGRSLPQSVTVSTAADGAACGYDFDRGQTYLVYANGGGVDEAALTTNSCMRTRAIDAAAEDLAYFAEMESGERTARISGQLYSPPEGTSPPTVDGVTVQLRSANSLRTTTTDSRGAFEFRGVPPHSYEVTALVPDGYVPARTREPVWIAHPTACAEVTLVTGWDGRITGTLIDSSGAPLR
jgi:hypothetical protein